MLMIEVKNRLRADVGLPQIISTPVPAAIFENVNGTYC